MRIRAEVNKHFKEFIKDNEKSVYFLLGGYGSGKSYVAAFKLIIMSAMEKRKILVVRQVKENLRGSCFADLESSIETLGLNNYFYSTTSPLSIKCTITGSEFIFRGLDDVRKIKSIKDIDTIWIEEADEIDFKSFKELKARLRSVRNRNVVILTTNPNEYGVWTYKYLMSILERAGKSELDLYNERIIDVTEETKLKSGKVYSENIYLHHSVYSDNKFLPDDFIALLENETDDFQRAIKTLGRFGSSGQNIFRNIRHIDQQRIENIIADKWNRYTGFDFGFERSYNAIVRMVIDEELNDLYICEEFYQNKLTDPEMLETEIIQRMIAEGEVTYADSAEPKAIAFYNMNGLLINAAKKTPDMSKSGVKKIQSFRNIFIDKNVCPNTYRELTELKWHLDKNGLVAKNPKTQKPFNIDPHTFDAIKYGISEYTPYILNKDYYKREEE